MRSAEIHIDGAEPVAGFLNDRFCDEAPFQFTDDHGATYTVRVMRREWTASPLSRAVFWVAETAQEPAPGMQPVRWVWRDTQSCPT